MKIINIQIQCSDEVLYGNNDCINVEKIIITKESGEKIEVVNDAEKKQMMNTYILCSLRTLSDYTLFDLSFDKSEEDNSEASILKRKREDESEEEEKDVKKSKQ